SVQAVANITATASSGSISKLGMECHVLRMRGCIANMEPRTIQETAGAGWTRRRGGPCCRWPCKPPKGYARYGREGARRIAQQSPMNSRTHCSTQTLDVAELVIHVAF